MSEKRPEHPIDFKKNQEITLTIDDLGTNGEGIGHREGCVFFVAGALPGEEVRVRIMKMKKRYGYARLLEIVTASSERVEPRCPAARPCGGCTLQHLSYEGQLAYKEKKIRDCLERIGGVNSRHIDWLPILGMENSSKEVSSEGTPSKEAPPWHYRNKAQFPVRRDKDGNPAAGFFAGHTHNIIPVASCAIQHPVINEVMKSVLDFMKEFGIEPYDEEHHRGLVRHLYVRRGYVTGQVMACLVLNGTSLPHVDKLIEALTKIDGMTSICLNVNKKQTNVILGKEMIPLWGPLFIEDNIGDIRYRISPQSFFQVNPKQTERLYDTVLSFADLTGTERVWDLYCGIGTISLFLASALKKGGQVTGVEIVPEAVENARENARINGIQNVSFLCGAAEDVAEEQGVDVIVVDPPRKGCDAALLDTMVRMGPERIVYVSCDPATLARDVKVLGEKGYRVEKVRGCDMFGQGSGVETVVLLGRKNTA